MGKYVVTYTREAYYTMVVDAKDIDEARSKAWDADIKDLEHDYDSGVFTLNTVIPQIKMYKL
jgi:hypothetical protein